MAKVKSSKSRPTRRRAKSSGGDARAAGAATAAAVDDAEGRTVRRGKLLWRGGAAGLLFPLALVTALPLVLSGELWQTLWLGERPQAWDGAGHYAVARIYSDSIFPDTFGWTHAYFGGMPFPNFYPPLYYWAVAALTRTGLFSFEDAFKVVTFAPVVLLPAALWLLGRAVSGRSRLVATASALAGAALLLDVRFLSQFPAGLDYFSTFQIGLYTQPLGFVLMAAWYALYSSGRQTPAKVALAALLLALVVLANFFNAVTAVVFVVATVACDLIWRLRAVGADAKSAESHTLLAHAAAPALAACLTLFWAVPLLGQYEYFVTRPYVIETGLLVTPALWVWYALAAAGALLWLRRPTRQTWPYLATCLTLVAAVVFATVVAPRWFPLQSPRFLTTLNFLLAVPVGQLLAAAFRAFAAVLGEPASGPRKLTLKGVRYTAGTAAALLALFILTAPAPRWGGTHAFYGKGEKAELGELLSFARERRDGRYLVEVINPTTNPAYADASFDARAVNAYLGAQGNQTMSAVFHEASPNALFTLPAVNALSDYPDSFGVSSLLADDLDFAEQPLARHVERARHLGVRYLVIRTPTMKERVAKEEGVGARHDFGWWSVFELRGDAAPHARALPYRPALVVSNLTLKQRRRNEWGFVRLAEEQFADGWFDVLLVHSPERKVDRLRDLNGFGALILDTYEHDDEDGAFAVLREFAQRRPLILLSSDSALFGRVLASRSDFPRLEVIERSDAEAGEVLEAILPTQRYQSSDIRRAWGEIRRALESNKVAVDHAATSVARELGQNSIRLQTDPATATAVPILIDTTFHPNWQREDGARLYAATPFYMLTFADHPARILYARRPHERAALWVSACTLALLCSLAAWGCVRTRFDSVAKIIVASLFCVAA